MNVLIASAQNEHDTAVEGTNVGNYPIGSKATLLTAINSAKAVANNMTSTQQQVDEAKTNLSAALQTFIA
ncbi:FIVAR domain-containing protein [Paenibacillus sp. 1_12]|uniref:FIVAR domain-containing protein n=1 Tax=Paenibacillus sp. 1_12 TaxID=1566278 RepID=UPI000B865629|nr:FIVAR domain-containing protein [Paenibacillus sp. 1_12]